MKKVKKVKRGVTKDRLLFLFELGKEMSKDYIKGENKGNKIYA